jgi:dienelactone hydrolase
MRIIVGALALVIGAGTAGAAVKTKEIEYEFDGTKLKGVLAFDDEAKGKQPGVIVFHEWWGLNDYAKKRAEQFAGLGYIAFAADMYGEGKVVDHPKEAGKMAQAVRTNMKAWQGRAESALKVLQSQENVEKDKIAAIGYCFGGSTALILAASGAPIKAVSTFHAALPPLTDEQAKMITARILVNHGADDGFISQDSIDKFKAALDKAGVKYHFESFPGAVHSFTVKEADKHEIKGMAYNEAADKKSWQMMLDLFKETLGK